MNKSLKCYDILNTKQEFFTPPIDITKDGIVTVSNLQTLRVGSILKFKTEEAYFGLVSTINANGTAEILALTNNYKSFQGTQSYLATIPIDFTLLIICIVFIISCCLFYILQELDSEVKFLQNSNNSNGNTSPEGGDKKPSDDGKPDPKDDNDGIIAGVLTFLNENKKIILISIGIGAITLGAYLLLNQYGISFTKEDMDNLYIDPLTQNSSFSDIEFWLKMDLLYGGELRSHCCITNLTSNSLKPSEFLAVLRNYPSGTREAVMAIINEISKNTMSEKEIIKSIPTEYINIFHELLTSLYNSKKK